LVGAERVAAVEEAEQAAAGSAAAEQAAAGSAAAEYTAVAGSLRGVGGINKVNIALRV